MSNQDENNRYLALREAKIKRNNEKLLELGLAHSKNNNHSNESPQEQNEKQQVTTLKKNNTVQPTRRSSRLTRSNNSEGVKSTISNNLNDSSIVDKKGLDHAMKLKKRKRTVSSSLLLSTTTTNNSNHEATNNNNHEVKTAVIMKPVIQTEAKPGTTRATSIDVSKVLCGDFNYPVFIGRQLSNTGKAAVTEHANLMCRNDVGISFNKYSGVCEWKDDVIFLWVNIDAPNAEVKNEFLNDGKMMTWYGGSRMKSDSIAIQKLLSLGRKATKNELSEKSGIILWCRVYDRVKKTFEAYGCLGRLGYHSHDDQLHPIKFVWHLLDYDILMNVGIEEGSLFQRIMSQ